MSTRSVRSGQPLNIPDVSCPVSRNVVRRSALPWCGRVPRHLPRACCLRLRIFRGSAGGCWSSQALGAVFESNRAGLLFGIGGVMGKPRGVLTCAGHDGAATWRRLAYGQVSRRTNCMPPRRSRCRRTVLLSLRDICFAVRIRGRCSTRVCPIWVWRHAASLF